MTEDGTSDFSLASVPISCLEGDGKIFIEYLLDANQCTGQFKCYLFLTGILWQKCCYPHFIVEKIEAQRNCFTSNRGWSQDQDVTFSGLKSLKYYNLESKCLNHSSFIIYISQQIRDNFLSSRDCHKPGRYSKE